MKQKSSKGRRDAPWERKYVVTYLPSSNAPAKTTQSFFMLLESSDPSLPYSRICQLLLPFPTFTSPIILDHWIRRDREAFKAQFGSSNVFLDWIGAALVSGAFNRTQDVVRRGENASNPSFIALTPFLPFLFFFSVFVDATASLRQTHRLAFS